MLSRLIWGARTSLAVAFASALFACVGGVALGLIGGWLRGFGELLTVRSIDVMLCFPPILLALLVVTLLGPGAQTMILVLSILYTPGFVRVTYGEVLSARSHDYVEAVRALGAGRGRILLPHHPAEHRRAGAGAVLADGRGRHGGGERAVLPRPRRRAAGAVLGPDDPRRARHHGAGAAAAASGLARRSP